MGDSSPGAKQKGSVQHSVFSRLLSLLFGGDDPERDKKRVLKQIASELSRHKYKFYKPRSGEALGGLAKFFFEIYRVIGPAQSLLQGSENSNALKLILIERFHTPEQQAARARFSEEAIIAAAEKLTPDKLVADIKDAMTAYVSGFNSAAVREINSLYTLMQQLMSFVRFDYYFLLRKFDSGLLEGNYTKAPRSEPINAEYISDDIKDFLEVLLALDHEGDWDLAISVLNEYRSVEVINAAAWKKLLSTMAGVVRSGVLVQIVQHVDRNPGFKPIVREEQFHIVESHLNIMKTQVEALMHKLMRERRAQRVQTAVRAVFGPGHIQRMRFYTERANVEFTKRMMAGFAHTEPMNYLAAFLLDYFAVEVRVLISESFIVRAEWSDNSLSGQLSEAFYGTLNNAEQVSRFDKSLGEDGELGLKIKRASGPTTKGNDSKSSRLLRQVVHDVDERAMNLITESAGQLITVGRILKTLIEDYDRQTPEIITNWRELESNSMEELKPQLIRVYKKIYSFIQLMQMFMK